MHDFGPLLPPREGGALAFVIAGVQQAKAVNDTFLTTVIQQQQHSQPSASPPSKKSKQDS